MKTRLVVGLALALSAATVPSSSNGFFETQPDSMNELQRLALQFFPVDCSTPSGIEFICDIFGP